MAKTLEQQIADIASEQQRQTALLEAIDKRLAYTFPYKHEPRYEEQCKEKDEMWAQWSAENMAKKRQWKERFLQELADRQGMPSSTTKSNAST